MFYSDDEDRILAEMYNAGHSWKEIASALGRSVGSVISRGTASLSLARKKKLGNRLSQDDGC